MDVCRIFRYWIFCTHGTNSMRNLFPSVSLEEWQLIVDALQDKERRYERNERYSKTAVEKSTWQYEIVKIRDLLGHMFSEMY